MDNKNTLIQEDKRRTPRQARAQQKIELMFEAAMCLLEEGGLRALNTNAVAARAGVNIGTLYQYFKDKQSLLDALVERELHGMATTIFESVTDRSITKPEERIKRIVHAVVGVYGGRTRVHRMLIEHSMFNNTGGKLGGLYENLITRLTDTEGQENKNTNLKISLAEAFVIVYSCAGVLRTYAVSETPPQKEEVELALVELITGYIDKIRSRTHNI